MDGAVFVDVLIPLRSALRKGKEIYSRDKDGHPLSVGYRVIGETVAIEVKKYLQAPRLSGLVKPTKQLDDSSLAAYEFLFSVGGIPWYLYVEGGDYWLPEDISTLLQTPNLSAREVDYRDIDSLRFRGRLSAA